MKAPLTKRSRIKLLASFCAVMLGLSACSGAPVPGGTEDVNETCFSSVSDMQVRILQLNPGMPEGEVLAKLCRKKETLVRLDRREIRIALLGGENILFSGLDADTDSQLISSLYGYKLSYKSLNRKHAFSSPIRIKTDETGYDYNVTLIFRDGTLFEKPILAGGLVNNASSGTIFDFITPGTIVSHLP